MENTTYELKNKNENLIFFKFLKLFAVFLVSWIGLWLILLFIMRPFVRRLTAEQYDFLTSSFFYISVGVVVLYIFSKVKNKQVEKIYFDYEQSILEITHKSYFLHILSVSTYSFDKIRSTLETKVSFLYGNHQILTIYYKKKRAAYIGGASADWQKLPNFLVRMHERIQEIRVERMKGKAPK